MSVKRKIRKLAKLSIIVYIIMFFVIFYPFAGFPGSDIVSGSFTYFGLVILSGVLLYISENK